MEEKLEDLAKVRWVKSMFIHAIATMPQKYNIFLYLLIQTLSSIAEIKKESNYNHVKKRIEKSNHNPNLFNQLCVSSDAMWYWEDLVERTTKRSSLRNHAMFLYHFMM